MKFFIGFCADQAAGRVYGGCHPARVSLSPSPSLPSLGAAAAADAAAACLAPSTARIICCWTSCAASSSPIARYSSARLCIEVIVSWCDAPSCSARSPADPAHQSRSAKRKETRNAGNQATQLAASQKRMKKEKKRKPQGVSWLEVGGDRTDAAAVESLRLLIGAFTLEAQRQVVPCRRQQLPIPSLKPLPTPHSVSQPQA